MRVRESIGNRPPPRSHELSREGVSAVQAHDVRLRVRNITKSFGGVKALDDVSVSFHAGEVHALLGENGAGKSTLVKIIAGVLAADSGSVTTPSGSGADDVAMVFQELSVIPTLSVRDNLIMSLQRSRGFRVSRRRMEAQVRAALAEAGLQGLNPDLPVEVLPLAQRQLLEIARGLAADARTLILDEPTATLSDVEIERVHAVVRSLVAQGRSIVYITHRLGEVFTLADRITVMRSGQVVATGTTDEFDMNSVVTHMLGEEHTVAHSRYTKDLALSPQPRTLTAHGLTSAKRFVDVDLEARAGEVTALFGQIGSGADELVRALAGLAPTDSGEVLSDGVPVAHDSRARSQRHGVSYVSADRVLEGVFLSATVVQNVSSGALKSVSRGSVIRAGAEERLAREIAGQVAFDSSRVRMPVGALSGGNQQKIAIARALATKPRVLLLNEPTRGVDIGARAEIYRAIRALAASNVVVIVYSSDIVEVRELADTVITMFRGRRVAQHRVDDVTDSRILTDILHGAQS
jgi:ribose transport system ATP-binding protein